MLVINFPRLRYFYLCLYLYLYFYMYLYLYSSSAQYGFQRCWSLICLAAGLHLDSLAGTCPPKLPLMYLSCTSFKNLRYIIKLPLWHIYLTPHTSTSDISYNYLSDISILHLVKVPQIYQKITYDISVFQLINHCALFWPSQLLFCFCFLGYLVPLLQGIWTWFSSIYISAWVMQQGKLDASGFTCMFP